MIEDHTERKRTVVDLQEQIDRVEATSRANRGQFPREPFDVDRWDRELGRGAYHRAPGQRMTFAELEAVTDELHADVGCKRGTDEDDA